MFIVGQLLWVGLTALIIYIDRQMIDQRTSGLEAVLDEGSGDAVPDLKDRSITPFLFLMVLFGGVVIPFYLWHSRRSSSAVVAGIGLMIVCGLLVGGVLATAS